MLILYDKYKNDDCSSNNISRIPPEDILDTLYCLCNSVENGILIQAGPETISIDEAGNVSILNPSELNLYYSSPEVILDKSKADKKSGWYTLGLLCYFLINGRSFYEDNSINLVNMKELQSKGRGLISADGIDSTAEDVPSLLRLAMEQFTLWDPEKRSNGVKYVLKAVKKYTSVAVINYEYNGQPIKSERVDVFGTSFQCMAKTKVVSENGQTYSVIETIIIPFRPGTHQYSVKVDLCECAVSDDLYEKFLCVRTLQQSQKVKLMKLETESKLERIRVGRSKKVCLMFYVLTWNPLKKNIVEDEYKYHVDVPADPRGGMSSLQVSYKPGFGVDIALFDESGVTQISQNVMHFDV